MKALVTIGTTYCGCPSETIEIEYWNDNDFAQAVLEAIFNSEAPHYFIDVEDEDYEEDFDEDEDDGAEWWEFKTMPQMPDAKLDYTYTPFYEDLD